MRFFPWALVSLVWILSGGFLCAQVDVRLETPRQSYLQYASIPLKVRIRNLGADSVLLKNSGGKLWLDLVVQSGDGLLIPPEKEFSPPEMTVRPGENRGVDLDLTPYYLVRRPGVYRVRASIRTPSGEALLTDPLQVLVGIGETVWQVPRGEGREQRVFSLVKFFEDPGIGLYLRVEVPQKNLVYPSRRLGPFLPLTKPVGEFDEKNHLHLLYPITSGSYRWTVVNQDGDLLREEERLETLEKPVLVKGEDGAVDVRGGKILLPSHLREKLSSLQSRIGAATPPPGAASPSR